MLIIIKRRLLGGAVVKNLPVDAEDMSFIPGSGRSPEGGNDIHSSIFFLGISWTEEPGCLESMESQGQT